MFLSFSPTYGGRNNFAFLFLVLSVCISVLVLLTGTTEATRLLLDSSKYKKLCQRMDHPDICFSVYKKFGNGDANALSADMLRVVKYKAKKASEMAENLKSNLNKKSMAYQLLDVCQTNFDSMSDDINSALQNIDGKKNNVPVNVSLSALSSYLETCTDGYGDSPEEKDPFTKLLKPMQELVENLFVMVGKSE